MKKKKPGEGEGQNDDDDDGDDDDDDDGDGKNIASQFISLICLALFLMSVHSIATLLRKFDLFLIFIVLLFYL
jgi:hypothetical protein